MTGFHFRIDGLNVLQSSFNGNYFRILAIRTSEAKLDCHKVPTAERYSPQMVQFSRTDVVEMEKILDGNDGAFGGRIDADRGG